MDSKAYDFLKKVYTDSLGKVYERDVRHLFEAAREKISGRIAKTKIRSFDYCYFSIDNGEHSHEKLCCLRRRQRSVDIRNYSGRAKKSRYGFRTSAVFVRTSVLARTTILRFVFPSNSQRNFTCFSFKAVF